MIFKLLKNIIKLTCKTVIKFIGLIVGMALGPGLLLLMFLYEPHRPLPEILTELPHNEIEASHVMQGRVDRVFALKTDAEIVREYFNHLEFTVNPIERHAVYKRRQLNCVEHYTVVWTEEHLQLEKIASLVERKCSPLWKG